jgi:hypothetical protein
LQSAAGSSPAPTLPEAQLARIKGKIMHTDKQSLHWAVDKWLAPTPAMPARVVRFCRTTLGRYVCVEALRPTGMLAIIFFRHDDGSWNVFPPQAKRPSMGTGRLAA